MGNRGSEGLVQPKAHRPEAWSPGSVRGAGPLARHSRLATASVDEFCGQASKLLTAHRIRRADAVDASPFRGQVRAVQIADLQLIYLEQGVNVQVDIRDPIDYYDLMLAVSGTNELVSDRGESTQITRLHGALLSPRRRAQMRMDATYRQLHVRIERHALERRLEDLIGPVSSSPVIFDLPVDLESPRLATWMSSLRLLLSDLDQDNGMTAHPLAAASWQDLLITGLLLAQPSNFTAALHDCDPPKAHRRLLREALDYCEQRVAEPVTVGEIARHVGASVRSLQRAFQDDLGISPTNYLQSLRLARVRQDLLTADSSSPDSVTEVALRWGFVHLSRFAAAYRRRYGEAPSDTRSRARERN
ncbi:helix-turn-helix transcriptional regulator [Amycolatopsis benzoatilytica]|uniref:helix-turn-helix transcriptional regulator n=1 Tax=Amycolatopsis benzoatilytica TaxID=346045 RepID=UPI001B7FB174|nr:helix-turn-helix domain-containing protein [Amycolatopsis benzoatilytica]